LLKYSPWCDLREVGLTAAGDSKSAALLGAFVGTGKIQATSGALTVTKSDIMSVLSPNGHGSVGMETSFFGGLTRAALVKYQKAKGITPAVGYFGPKTRAALAAE
jgi:hypothetical protein